MINFEIAQVLRRYGAPGELSEPKAREALGDLGELPVTRYLHALFLDRIWDLHHRLTPYDALDVALAEACRAPLVTCHRPPASVLNHRAQIDLVV